MPDHGDDDPADSTLEERREAAADETLLERPARGSTTRRPEVTGADDADYPQLISVDGDHYAGGREIARGGMGRISLARDRRLGRRVAIKELLSRDEWLAARFEREVRITAKLQHPNIIHVYEAGRWSSGEPFYAMNLVTGRRLDVLIAEAATPDARLALVSNVLAVVDALAYAHSEGVIHRDLKPNNVLVGSFGETVVIDWGIAKDLSAPDPPPSTPIEPSNSTVETVAGTVLGTPAYMPPEQAGGIAVDATADVYALGAMLYHVLAGVPPYSAPTNADLLAMVRDAPPRPLAEITPNAPGDLVAIVEKAMARDRTRRFPTAKEMAEELKRFQTGQLVTSYRYTTRELIRRWIRRHRGAVAVAALAAVVLVIVGAISITRVVGAERRAVAAQARAEHRADQVTLAQARASLESDPTATLGWLTQLGNDPQAWAEARAIAADAGARGVAHVLQAGTGETAALAFSGDGHRLASGGDDGVIRVWDLSTWHARELGRARGRLLAVAFDGERVVAVDAAGAIQQCVEAGGCTVVRPAAAGDAFQHAACASDGRRCVLLGDHAMLWDAASSTPRALGSVRDAAWSADGSRLLLATSAGVDRLELATGAITTLWTTKPDDRGIASLATDGTRIWVSRVDDHRIYELVDGRLVEQHSEHDGPVTRIAYVGGALVSSSSDQEVRDPVNPLARVFRAGDHSIIVWHHFRDFERFVGHAGNIASLVVSLRGDTIASGGADGTIRVWRVAGPSRLSDESYRPAVVAAVADHGRAVIAGRPGWPAGVRPSFDVIDLATGKVRSLVCCDTDRQPAAAETRIDAERLAIDATGSRFVALDSDGVVTAWAIDQPRGRFLTSGVTATAIANDGRTIVTAGADGAIRAWDITTGRDHPIGDRADKVTAIACSDDAAAVAVADATGVHVYGRTARVLDKPPEPIGALAFSPDGRKLVGGGAGDASALYVWDLAGGIHRTWTGHGGAIRVLAFAPDGTVVASGSVDKTVRVWRMLDGNVTVLRGHAGGIGSVAFRGDGRALVTAGDDRIAWLWDLASGSGRPLRGHHGFVLVAGFTGADGRIVSVDRDGEVRFHADDLPSEEPALRAWLAAATNVVVEPARPAPPPPPLSITGCAPGQTEDRGRCRDVAAGLNGLRWQLPCQPHRSGDLCDAALPRTTKVVQLAGDPATAYEVTLWFRGVVEQQSYTDGSGDGMWYVGGHPAQTSYNVYELRTSSPEQVFFLNAGKAGVRHVWSLDYKKTIRVTGNATITLGADAQDQQQVANRDAEGQPVVVANIPPAPAPFDGQFIQVDVVSVVAVPTAPTPD